MKTILGNQKGEGRAGFLISAAVVLMLGFCAVQYIPVRVAAYEFRDHLREEARYGAIRNDNTTVTKRILEKAGDLDIPLTEKNISVHRTKSEIIIKAHYEQPINFKVTTYTYKFDAEERAPLF